MAGVLVILRAVPGAREVGLRYCSLEGVLWLLRLPVAQRRFPCHGATTAGTNSGSQEGQEVWGRAVVTPVWEEWEMGLWRKIHSRI